MKRLLIAAYYYPPAGWGGVQRVSRWVKYLTEEGWRCTVVTVSPDEYEVQDESLLKDVPADVRVQRRRLPPRGIVGDPGLRWLPGLTGELHRVVDAERPSVLLLTGSPFFPFLAGRLLRLTEDLPYVLDFRDPWTLGPWWPNPSTIKGTLKTWTERYTEAVSVEGAGACLFAQPGIAELYRNHYSSLENRAVTLPNGYDPREFPEAGHRSVLSAKECYRIVHTGSWVADRTPALILDAMALLQERSPDLGCRLRARFLGHAQLASELEVPSSLDGRVQFVPYVPHERCLEELRAADILWLDTGPDPKFVPGKLFEYLASNKPVLAATHEGGTSMRWLREEKRGWHAGRSPETVCRALERLILELDAGIELPDRRDGIDRFSRQTQSHFLSRVLSAVAKGETPPNLRDTYDAA